MLATDEVQTVAVFIYKDINWGQRAQIGFNVGDGYTAFVFPEALSNRTLDMDESSNAGKLGVYVHRIDSKSLSFCCLSLSFSISHSISSSLSFTQFRSNLNHSGGYISELLRSRPHACCNCMAHYNTLFRIIHTYIHRHTWLLGIERYCMPCGTSDYYRYVSAVA